MDKTKKIAQLNDVFRQTFIGGEVVLTNGVLVLPDEERETVVTKVREYNDFHKNNDPHQEHDFGNFEHDGVKYFWKIDYYDAQQLYGSEDPADPKQTTRVLTIMQAVEY